MSRDSKWFKDGAWWCRRVMMVTLYASTREWKTVQRGVVLNGGRARTLKEAKARAEEVAYDEAAIVIAALKGDI